MEHNLRNADPIFLNKQFENESVTQTVYPCCCNKMKIFFDLLRKLKIILFLLIKNSDT